MIFGLASRLQDVRLAMESVNAISEQVTIDAQQTTASAAHRGQLATEQMDGASQIQKVAAAFLQQEQDVENWVHARVQSTESQTKKTEDVVAGMQALNALNAAIEAVARASTAGMENNFASLREVFASVTELHGLGNRLTALHALTIERTMNPTLAGRSARRRMK